MGFWDVTKRIIQGKPGFEAPKQSEDWDDDRPTTDFSEERKAKRAVSQGRELYDEHGYKHIPIATVNHIESRPSGEMIDLWATIENHSERVLVIDKLSILGMKTVFDWALDPGQGREVRIYRGPQMRHDHYKKAELYYKDKRTGDYFRADHLIGYRYETDKTFDVDELKLITPIYDV